MNRIILSSTALFSILVIASCGGSSPAPWSKPDESPWREVQQPSQEVAYQPTEPTQPEQLPAPVSYQPDSSPAMEAPEMVEATSAMPMEEMGDSGMPAPEGIEAEAMVVEASAADAVLAMPATSYAVQVYASSKEENAMKFIENNGLDDLKVVKTDRGNDVFMYVVVGLYDDRASAVDAATDLEVKLGSQPWVRSMPSLQKIVAQ